jgi:hypothetical protein
MSRRSGPIALPAGTRCAVTGLVPRALSRLSTCAARARVSGAGRLLHFSSHHPVNGDFAAASMLDSLFRRSLELKVGDRTLRFGSRVDFEFALASRTEVPAGKISELVRFDAQQLLDEASSVRDVERHFVDVLSRSMQEPGSIGYLVRQMDMKLFSQDHEWRAIMQALARQDGRFDDYKQLALVKYMQYLASRQDVLKGIYTHKASLAAHSREPESSEEVDLRETLIFDVSAYPAGLGARRQGTSPPARFIRLPRGERVRIRAGLGEPLEVVLSRHPFRIVDGSPPMLVDDDGKEHPLHTGRNVLGRHPDSDIMLDAAYRDVSRTHLILELDESGEVRLTDLSSHGTFVPAVAIGDEPPN